MGYWGARGSPVARKGSRAGPPIKKSAYGGPEKKNGHRLCRPFTFPGIDPVAEFLLLGRLTPYRPGALLR